MKYFTSLVFLLLSFTASAQTSWSWGLTLSGGLSAANDPVFDSYENGGVLTYSNLQEFRHQPNFGGGLWLAKEWGRHIETIFGLEYFKKSRFSRTENTYYNNFGAVASFYQNEHYTSGAFIQAPLKVNYVFRRYDKKFRPFVGVGAAASYLLRSRYSSESMSVSGGEIVNHSIHHDKADLSEDYVRNLLWSVPLIAQVGVRLGNIRLSVQQSYTKSKDIATFSAYTSPYYYGGPTIIYCDDCDYPYGYGQIESPRDFIIRTRLNFEYKF